MKAGAYPTVTFEKWEGLGNDFILVPCHERFSAFDTKRTENLCDRHRGIGADGILYVTMDTYWPGMSVYNADGSRAQMCGNGLRCVAAYIAQEYSADKEVVEVVIDTAVGPKRCVAEQGIWRPHVDFRLEKFGSPLPGTAYAVTVDMGIARQAEPLYVPIAGNTHVFTMIDMGNPHAITFDPAYTQSDIDVIGPLASTAFPGGTNVEFCRIDTSGPRPRIEVTVWERGVGRTLACGTGACAVVAAACDAQAIAFDQVVDVVLPGGILEITVASNREVRMRGPARRVFRGEAFRL